MAESKRIGHETYEYEIVHENGPNCEQLYNSCSKNPGHLDFIPAGSFRFSHLPSEIRTPEVFKFVKSFIDRTVKVSVKYTSLERPDTYPSSDAPYPYKDLKGSKRAVRCGTGVISRRCEYGARSAMFEYVKDQPCPCFDCNDFENESLTPATEYAVAIITTATHVIFDDAEAKSAKFEMFYDSDNARGKVKYLYGVGLSKSTFENYDDGFRSQQDRVRVNAVTHDPELIKILRLIEPKLNCGVSVGMKRAGVIISHPHGGSKRVTIGNIIPHVLPKVCPEFRPGSLTSWVFYNFKPGTKCRNAAQESRYTIRQLGGSRCEREGSGVAKHGEEFLLQKGLLVSIPVEFPIRMQNHRVSNGWISFPSKTKFTPDEGDNWFVSPGLEFEFGLDNSDLPAVWHERPCLTYDISTCPGSSGAAILYSERNSFCVNHSGAILNGPNKSTLFHFHPK